MTTITFSNKMICPTRLSTVFILTISFHPWFKDCWSLHVCLAQLSSGTFIESCTALLPSVSLKNPVNQVCQFSAENGNLLLKMLEALLSDMPNLHSLSANKILLFCHQSYQNLISNRHTEFKRLKTLN